MTLTEAIILGIIQGLTEFLPVSSSGHIELGTAIFGIQSKENLLFSVLVHLATALSTIVVFRKEILTILKDLLKFEWNESVAFTIKIIISMVPIGIVGVFFEDQITALFGGNVILVGCMLLVTGALLAFTYFQKDTSQDISYGKAFVIGIAQAIAIMPGISRSGSTIATALILKVDKAKAAKFSFLMVLVPILGAAVLKLKDYLELKATGVELSISSGALVAGFVAAFVFGYLACNWMIGIVKKGKLIYFAYYCFAAGLIAIISYFLQ
ncbi:MAG: undecaprenyl-diphosphate phosphatase [Bacteroidota bacterium]